MQVKVNRIRHLPVFKEATVEGKKRQQQSVKLVDYYPVIEGACEISRQKVMDRTMEMVLAQNLTKERGYFEICKFSVDN